MKTSVLSSSHAVGESNYHLLLTPAYRRDIFVDRLVVELTIGYILLKLRELWVLVLAHNFWPDYLHLLVANVRHVSEVELVRQIKGYSSYMVRKGHGDMFRNKLWGEKFWSECHFYRSAGDVNKDTMQHYIKDCWKKHWTKTRNQTILAAY